VATSRTGTATYLRARRRVIAQAQRDGVTHCPGYTDTGGVHHPCGVELDYTTPHLPNSAEVDHIQEARYGGGDDATNLRVLCRRQNLERNRTKQPVAAAPLEDFPTTRAW